MDLTKPRFGRGPAGLLTGLDETIAIRNLLPITPFRLSLALSP